MFRGRYRHTIDAKGRLSIPARYRELLKSAHGDVLMVVPLKNRPVHVYPVAEWQVLEAKVDGLSNFDPVAIRFREQFLSFGEEVVVDPQGRIQLRQECRERGGLGRDVVIVGMGRFFTIWDAARLAEHDELEAAPMDELFAQIAAKGV